MPTSSFIAPSLETDFSNEWSAPELLSTGVYNAIYVATRYGKRFVLKALREEYRDSLPHQELLRKEFQLGVPLDHANIVRTLDWGHMDSIGNYIQMEFVDGITLSAFLETKPKHRVRKQILLELIEAVGYLHQHQIIHRDIKPSNILITRNGQHVKLIDLGVADADDYVALKQPAGSFAFIAPEQLSGEVLDGRADIYSIGKVMRLLFSCRYWLIAQKCTAANRKHRYGSCVRLLRSIQWSDTLKRWIPVCVLLCCLIVEAYANIQHWRSNEQQETEMQHSQVTALQQTTDSIQHMVDSQQVFAIHITKVVDSQQVVVKSITQAVDSMEIWEYQPTDDEIAAFSYQVDKLLTQKVEELTLAAQRGDFDSVQDRKTFFNPIIAWIDSERNKINNKKLQDAFTNVLEHHMGFGPTCEYIYNHLPLVIKSQAQNEDE